MTTFEAHRGQLFGIAYRMVGTAMDAEDIVQEAWLRYQQSDMKPENPGAYLRKIVTNLSLDHLKSARVQREQYIGEWLPEPIVTESSTPADKLAQADSISMAFLVLLEQLSPLERASFILRQVFEYDYAAIAQMLNRSESACRKLFSRAKQHLDANQPRFDATPEKHRQLVAQFIEAVREGNIEDMANVLADDATLVTDGGGNVPAATRPLHGRERIRAFIAGLLRKAQKPFTIESAVINGSTGAILRTKNDDRVLLIATFDVHDEHIQTIRLISNPDKLTRV